MTFVKHQFSPPCGLRPSFLEDHEVEFREAANMVSKMVGFRQDGLFEDTLDGLIEAGAERDAASILIPPSWRYSSGKVAQGEYLGVVISDLGKQRFEYTASTEGLALLGALALAFVPESPAH